MNTTYKISVIAGGGDWSKTEAEKETAINEAKRLARKGENLGVHVYEMKGNEVSRMIGNFYIGNF